MHGKIGLINRSERNKIATIAENLGLSYCEIAFDGCWHEAHAPAHRHERLWYRGQTHLLSALQQWLSACNQCHDYLDNHMTKEEREVVFMTHRGVE